ncbi:DUF4097 family beta strand repeat-containing protein [Streptomyces sp. NPDC002055]|uniref:DUF4097 family beta strand repeat-containing protein n=1 Tax=Streptomyces sp. NPDC002055 TaxID=3154534 RepID=UPI00332B2969
MSARSEWSIGEPRTLALDEPVSAVTVRIVGGTVNVVGTDSGEPARLEVSELDGPPLTVTQEGSVLTVTYDDLTRKGLFAWLDRRTWRDRRSWLDHRSWKRHAVVSVTVPAGSGVEVGVVGAAAFVSGVSGRTELRSVSGDSTLVGLTGPVRAETVSGRLEAQSVTGDLRFQSVSGDLTVLDGSGTAVTAETVSGNLALDLAPVGAGPDIRLTTVSGEVAIRLPHPADATVTADTTSGALSNAFDDLRVTGQWGAKRITGTLGAGTGTLTAATVSGAIALLRRPAAEDAGAPDGAGPHLDDGAAPAGPDGSGAPARPTDKKVL